jgi:hypothetical protein
MKAPTSLRVNLLKTPYNLRRSRLALSWHPNAEQTAYRVVVTRGQAGTPVFDSDWVPSPACTSVRPKGLVDALTENVLYYASVAVRDVEGGESDFSVPLAFTVAPPPAAASGIWAQGGDFAL